MLFEIWVDGAALKVAEKFVNGNYFFQHLVSLCTHHFLYINYTVVKISQIRMWNYLHSVVSQQCLINVSVVSLYDCNVLLMFDFDHCAYQVQLGC